MIYQKNNFKVVRPLLNIHRFEIRQFVRFWKLPIYSDQSNQKTNFLRNKIRKQLLPTLRLFFNPQIDAVLLNFINIKKNEELYFQNILNFLLKPEVCDPLFVFSLDDEIVQSLFVCISWIKTETNIMNHYESNIFKIYVKPFIRLNSKNKSKLLIKQTNYLNTYSRNQIIYWLILDNNIVKKLHKYPNLFQRQVLKTIVKTYNQVEKAYWNLQFLPAYENKLTQLLIIKFTKKLFSQKEKKNLLIILQNLINKY